MATTTSMINYYEILEIPSDSDEREIKAAYHRLARQLHPDKAATADEARRAEERFASVSAAYNALKDPDKRAEFDKTRVKSAEAAAGGGPATSNPAATATARVLAASRARDASAPTTSAVTASSGTVRQSSVITPERVAIAQKAFVRGMQFYKENNVSKAIDFFEAAIQNNDQEGLYHARLAMALIREKRSATRALDAAQRAIDLDPYNVEYKFDLAFIYEAIGSKSNAIKIYEEILRWEADNSRAKLALEGLSSRKRGPFGIGGSGGGGSGDGTGHGHAGASKGSFLQQILDMFKKK
jgi:curved DNA-binding protein CbpA